jgi:hypothetical protein
LEVSELVEPDGLLELELVPLEVELLELGVD